MITNTGKSIIGKYMLGQAPAYASYLAVGCGPTPLQTEDVADNFATKTNLDFEMFRVPISSRGFVNEDGIDKIVLTAELPTEERYEITEVGLYSAGSNPSASANDSKTVFSFTAAEGWEHHTSSASTEIESVSIPLDDPDDDDVIAAAGTETGVFQTNADNKTFTNSNRVLRYERCRFLNNIIAIVGNNANISKNSANHLIAETGSNYIQLSDTAIDLGKNSPTDELRLAFSLINKNGAAVTIPDKVRVIVEFSSSGTFATGSWARFEAEINYNDPGVNFATNRYFIISKQLQELYKSENFAWSDINTVRIYSSVIKDSAPTSDFYVCLDGLRLENTTSTNSVYGLTGYSVIRSTDAKTIIKSANTTNYIEFRFSLDVA